MFIISIERNARKEKSYPEDPFMKGTYIFFQGNIYAIIKKRFEFVVTLDLFYKTNDILDSFSLPNKIWVSHWCPISTFRYFILVVSARSNKEDEDDGGGGGGKPDLIMQ